MRHGQDVDAIADDDLEEGLGKKGAGGGHRHRPDPGYLTHLAVLDMPTPESGRIDTQMHDGRRARSAASGPTSPFPGHLSG